jgi:glutaredoxin 3
MLCLQRFNIKRIYQYFVFVDNTHQSTTSSIDKAQELRELMTQIELYTRPGCGYCTFSKRLLLNKKLPFDEYDVYQQPEYLGELRARTNNRTFPQIFIDGKNIGGFTELLELEQSGRLTIQK